MPQTLILLLPSFQTLGRNWSLDYRTAGAMSKLQTGKKNLLLW
ncbi:hypothetical protein [Aerosakkonema funiforme]